MPSHVDGQETGEYLVERTLYRPRDIIVFFNKCIEKSHSEPRVSLANLKAAESDYSQARIHAIFDEWRDDYPDLKEFVKLLKGKATTFRFGLLDATDVATYCLDYSVGEITKPGSLSVWAKKVAENDLDPMLFMRRAVCIFYRVGLVGIKTDKSEPIHWSFRRGATIQPSDISDDSSVSICPAFFRALAVNVRRRP